MTRLPNALTCARVALAVLLFVILDRAHAAHTPSVAGGPPSHELLLAAGVFVLGALTDALDGFLARRWNVVSHFGRVMDPFADKLLVLGAFVMLAGPNFALRLAPDQTVQLSGVQPWMVVVMLARELLVTSLRGVLESRGVDFSATLTGKLKMILQSLCIPLVLLLMGLTPLVRNTAEPTLAGSIVVVTVWATVVVTAWSGVPYVFRALRHFQRSTPQTHTPP